MKFPIKPRIWHDFLFLIYFVLLLFRLFCLANYPSFSLSSSLLLHHIPSGKYKKEVKSIGFLPKTKQETFQTELNKAKEIPIALSYLTKKLNTYLKILKKNFEINFRQKRHGFFPETKQETFQTELNRKFRQKMQNVDGVLPGNLGTAPSVPQSNPSADYRFTGCLHACKCGRVGRADKPVVSPNLKGNSKDVTLNRPNEAKSQDDCFYYFRIRFFLFSPRLFVFHCSVCSPTPYLFLQDLIYILNIADAKAQSTLTSVCDAHLNDRGKNILRRILNNSAWDRILSRNPVAAECSSCCPGEPWRDGLRRPNTEPKQRRNSQRGYRSMDSIENRKVKRNQRRYNARRTKRLSALWAQDPLHALMAEKAWDLESETMDRFKPKIQIGTPIKMTTLIIEGMITNPAKREMLETWACKDEIGILLLQETKLNCTQKETRKNIIYTSHQTRTEKKANGQYDDRTEAGVAIMIKNDLIP